ncbi:MAG: transposase [Hyphomicrobiales bacterium]|nr:transposase [Hyphomicrobiales bacterium]
MKQAEMGRPVADLIRRAGITEQVFYRWKWLSAPCGWHGRPAHFSNSAIELCLTLRALFNLPLRQTGRCWG